MVVQFAVAALCERRKPLSIKTAVIDRRYNKIKLYHYPLAKLLDVPFLAELRW